MALGPSLAGLAEHITGNPYIIFYLALGLHAINALSQWFIIPESLLPAQMDAARRAKRKAGKGHWFIRMFSFFSPLTLLAPLPQNRGDNSQKASEKDWSLTWLALSLAPESLVLGGMQYWYQYAVGKFNWSAEMVGMPLKRNVPILQSRSPAWILYKFHWIHPSTRSSSWATWLAELNLVLCLLLQLIDVLHPAVLKLFASRSQPVQLPTSPDEPLDASSSLPHTEPALDSARPHTPAVDLGIAKLSLALLAVVFVLVAVSKDTGTFVAANALGALAACYTPTTHSLSMELYTRRGGAPSEAGKLFGAVSVIQTIGCAPFIAQFLRGGL